MKFMVSLVSMEIHIIPQHPPKKYKTMQVRGPSCLHRLHGADESSVAWLGRTEVLACCESPVHKRQRRCFTVA